MGSIAVRFINNVGTLTGSVNISDANVTRILNAEKINLRTGNNQETIDEITRKLFQELKGDTRTVERNQTVIVDIPEE